MSEKNSFDFFQTLLQYRRIIAFGLCLLGLAIIDLVIGSSLPFWIAPLILGIIAGVIVGYAQAGIFSALGSMAGRLLSIIIMIFTKPGLLETSDLFLAAIGDVLGAPLPPGALTIVLLSVVICGLFGLFGGLAGGSATKIVLNFMESQQAET